MAFDSPHLIPKCQDHPFQTPLSARSEPSRRRVDLASRMQSICQPQLPAMTEIGGILLVKFCFGQLPIQPPQNVHCLLSQLYPPMSFPREQAGWPHPQWVPRPMIPLDHSGDEFQQAYWTYWPQASSSVKMGPKLAKYIYNIYICNIYIYILL